MPVGQPPGNYGIPRGLENVLGNLLQRQIGRMQGGALSAGSPSGGRGGGLQETLSQLFALQDRRLQVGRLYGALGGLAKGLGGGQAKVGRF